MRKIMLILAVALIMLGCTVPEAESTMYVVDGYYYAVGEVVTNDGNIWGYSQDNMNDSPVHVVFDNMGTPDNIYDDEILGVIVHE